MKNSAQNLLAGFVVLHLSAGAAWCQLGPGVHWLNPGEDLNGGVSISHVFLGLQEGDLLPHRVVLTTARRPADSRTFTLDPNRGDLARAIARFASFPGCRLHEAGDEARLTAVFFISDVLGESKGLGVSPRLESAQFDPLTGEGRITWRDESGCTATALFSRHLRAEADRLMSALAVGGEAPDRVSLGLLDLRRLPRSSSRRTVGSRASIPRGTKLALSLRLDLSED